MNWIATHAFNLAFVGYNLSFVLYLSYLFTRRDGLGRWAHLSLQGAVALHGISLLLRVVMASLDPAITWYVPWGNWFDSFSSFALVIALVFLAVQLKNPMPVLGAFTVPWAWVAVVMSLLSPLLRPDGPTLEASRAVMSVDPDLQSYWMAVHVPIMFLAYATFANAFGVGVAYLIQERQLKSKHPGQWAYRLPPLDKLDQLIYHLVFLGFPVLTVGILMGAQWANEAWGRYWGWDAKETWAFITWVVYLVYLGLRWGGGWRGRRTAYLSLAGFLLILFTYVGVNYFSELHGFLSEAGK